MHSKNLALAIIASAASTAVAEFAIITTPLPTNLNVLTNLDGYKSSILSQVSSGLASLTADSGALSSASSAHAGLASFVATATYSIPSDVTKIGAVETFSTTPAWYSALPSDVKAYYDKFNKEVQGLIDQAILGSSAATTASGASAKPTGTGANSKPTETGAAAILGSPVGAMGAGIVAAFAGVMAL